MSESESIEGGGEVEFALDPTYRDIVENVGAAIFIFSGDRNIYANAASEKITGYTRGEITSMQFWTFIHPDYREMVMQRGRDRQSGGAVPEKYELKIVTKQGQEKWIDFTAKMVQISGRPCVIGIVNDISERKAVAETLQRIEAQNRAMLKAIPDMMFLLDFDGTIRGYHSHDPAALYSAADRVIGFRIHDTMPPHFVEICMKHVIRAIDTDELQIFEYELEVGGTRRDFEARLSLTSQREVLAIVRDVTERKIIEGKLHFLAYNDALTGLPNRISQLDQLRKMRDEGMTNAVLLFVDLDRFKVINDSLGHAFGDLVLQQVATRFKAELPSDAFIARHGGDEFIVFAALSSLREAEKLAEQVLQSLQPPFTIKERDFYLTASIGIASMPDDGIEPEELLMNADTAMYEIKRQGGGGYRAYRSSLHTDSVYKLETESALRRALVAGDFSVHFQPRVMMPERRITGLEALVRWNRDGSIIMPGHFIGIAEETGLISKLGQWVLENACIRAKAWLQSGTDFRLAVNVSPREFQQVSLFQTVAGILERVNFPPQNLEIEITEDAVLYNPALAAETLHSMKKLGIRIAIDDFGKGQSSMGQLRNLPIDTLKIDREFIRDVQSSPQNRAIVRSMLALSAELNLEVIAEGVETEEQAEWLLSAGCKHMQGYLLSPPRPEHEIDKFFQPGIIATL